MARRHLKLTLTITLDEDLCRTAEDAITRLDGDGDSPYTDSLNILRTAVQHHASIILGPFDPHLDNPIIDYNGIDYAL